MKILITTILFFFFTTNLVYAEAIYIKTNIIKTPQGIFRTCAKKNDIPKKSRKNHKWHIDRECCLDPYEIPNKSCYYGLKYQNLLIKYYEHISHRR